MRHDAEWLGVAYACAATALSDLTFGMIAPFFPAAALECGVSQSMVGAIFAVQAAGVCVGSGLEAPSSEQGSEGAPWLWSSSGG